MVARYFVDSDMLVRFVEIYSMCVFNISWHMDTFNRRG